MIFSDQLLFLHVPKTGGMAVTGVLLSLLHRPVDYTQPEPLNRRDDGLIYIRGVRHETLSDAERILPRYCHSLERFTSSLAAIRNPYYPEVSRYAYQNYTG
jgi:hypothetical protein